MPGDLRVVGGAAVTPVFKFASEDRDTSTTTVTIKAGDAVEAGGTGNNFALFLITGDPTQTSSNRFIGPAHNESTETATADGYVDVECVVPMLTVLEGNATTKANIDTAAEFDAIQNDTVALDGITAITGNPATTPYTIDEDEGDDPNDHGLVIVGGDIARGTLQVVVKPLVTLFGNNL